MKGLLCERLQSLTSWSLPYVGCSAGCIVTTAGKDVKNLLLPPEVRFFYGHGLVEPSDDPGVRGVLDQIWISLGLFGDGDHGVAECVKGLPGLGLCRFDHDGLVNNEREVHCGRVEAIILEALGDVPRVHPLGLLIFCREDALVHAGDIVGDIIVVLQALFDVVGIEDRVLAHLSQSLSPQTSDIGIGPDEDAKVSIESMDAPYTLGSVIVERVSVTLFFYSRNRNKGGQCFSDTDRPCPRPSEIGRAHV